MRCRVPGMESHNYLEHDPEPAPITRGQKVALAFLIFAFLFGEPVITGILDLVLRPA